MYFCAMKFFSGNIVLTLLFLLIFNGLNEVSAKTNDTILVKNFQVEIRSSYGFMICHHQEMKIFKSHFPLFELSIQQATFGRKSWQSKSNYPAVGVSFLYSGLGNFKEIGSVYALYPYITFNCLKSVKNQLNLKAGIGFGYLTTTYDAKTNPKNTFIGSHANAAISLAVEYNRQITNRLSASVFIGFTHFSNGARRAPNNGINIAHAGISAKYFINQPATRLPRQNNDNKQYKSWKWENISFYAAFTYSFKDTDEYMGYGKSWSVYNLQLNAFKRLTEMSKLGIGFDLVYDQTDKVVLDFKEISYTDVELIKPGLNIAYEIAFGSSSFVINVGYHLAGKDMSEGHLYQKINALQKISKHIFATCGLTTHFGWADYFGFGLGYRFN